jgi:hypothetical protein
MKRESGAGCRRGASLVPLTLIAFASKVMSMHLPDKRLSCLHVQILHTYTSGSPGTSSECVNTQYFQLKVYPVIFHFAENETTPMHTIAGIRIRVERRDTPKTRFALWSQRGS